MQMMIRAAVAVAAVAALAGCDDSTDYGHDHTGGGSSGYNSGPAAPDYDSDPGSGYDTDTDDDDYYYDDTPDGRFNPTPQPGVYGG